MARNWLGQALCAGIVTFGCNMAYAQPSANAPGFTQQRMYYLQVDDYKIDVNRFGGTPWLGVGIDLSDPSHPILRDTLNPMVPRDQALALQQAQVKPYRLEEYFHLEENQSVAEEAGILSTYFNGTYGLSSVQAAFDQAKSLRRESSTVYVVLSSEGESHSLAQELAEKDRRVLWQFKSEDMRAEQMDDTPGVIRQFLGDYGSHYVSEIVYGYRMGIQARIAKSVAGETSKVAAAMKAAFVGASAGGGVSDEQKKTLTESHVEMTLELSGGGLYDQDGRRLAPVVRGYDDIQSLLDDLRSGKRSLQSGPISARLRSYETALPAQAEKSRQVYTFQGTPATSPFGVPAGTVIAWYPPPANLARLDQAVDSSDATAVQIVPPDGWAICNGENGTPDLRQLFVRGASQYADLGESGTDQHTHGIDVGRNTAFRFGKNRTTQTGKGIDHDSFYGIAAYNHSHGASSRVADNVPRYYALIYLMKLP